MTLYKAPGVTWHLEQLWSFGATLNKWLAKKLGHLKYNRVHCKIYKYIFLGYENNLLKNEIKITLYLPYLQWANSTQDSESCDPSSNLSGTSMFCNGGGFLSVNECFQWDRVPSILPMRTKSQGNEVILSTYYHPNLIRTTPLLINFCLSKFKTKNN